MLPSCVDSDAPIDRHRVPCFSIFYHNAGGINLKCKYFLIHGPLIDEDGIAITETWLSGDRFSSEFFDADVFEGPMAWRNR